MADENIRTGQETYVTGERVLFGRRQIFCTVDDINEDNIISEVNSALSIHIQNLMDMEYLYWYRRGLQPILNRQKEVRPVKIINHRESKISLIKDSTRMVKDVLQIKKRLKKEFKNK